jgi:hypothetical protein
MSIGLPYEEARVALVRGGCIRHSTMPKEQALKLACWPGIGVPVLVDKAGKIVGEFKLTEKECRSFLWEIV